MPRILPLVLVEWEDSTQPVAAWQFLDQIEDAAAILCQSVGFLIHDGADAKTLAPNVGETGLGSAQASGVVQIPTRCIRRIRKLNLGHAVPI